jgi:hypothetical protein
LLHAKVFDLEVTVPVEFIASKKDFSKKCLLLKGTAGSRRMRVLAEIKKDRVKKASKIQFMQMDGSSGKAGGGGQQQPQPQSVPPKVPVQEVVIPEVVLPSSDEDDFTQVLHICFCTGASF